MSTFVLGSVVYSKSGRDCGSYYAVIQVLDSEYVLIADGAKRRIENPKRKKVKHIKPNGIVLDKIANKLSAGEIIYNAELKSALREYNDKL